MKNFKELLHTPEYDFLRTTPELKDNIILLGLGGSYSYGTNVETSDVDIRGIATQSYEALLGMHKFDQVENKETDTTIYSLEKVFNLMANCNPNVIELLGLKPEHYIVLTESGKKIIDNSKIFLSKRAVHSFGGYATAQLRRLQNALAHDSYPESEKTKHILGSLTNAMYSFNQRYNDKYKMNLYIKDEQLMFDAEFKEYPFKDANAMLSEMTSIIREYTKLNNRNKKKDDAHLNKHAMHLVRLLLTGTELLRDGVIHTYREKEHDLLMDIRNGKYQKDNHDFRPEFFEMLDQLEHDFKDAADNSSLPDKPDMIAVNDLLIEINENTINEYKRVTADDFIVNLMNR